MKKQSRSLFVLRYGIGGAMCVAGIVLLVTNTGGFGVDGFALGAGAGLSLIMLNVLYRLGVSGDRERDQEEDARDYLERHGYWPDEADQHRPAAARTADEHHPPSSRVHESSRSTKIAPPRATESHVDRFARR